MSVLVNQEVLARIFIYSLFIFSAFSNAGSEASIFFLYIISLYGLIRNPHLPKLDNPMLWMVLIFIFLSVINGLLNDYEVNTWEALRSNWRLILPFVLLPFLKLVEEPFLLRFYFFSLILFAAYGIIQYFTGVDWFRADEDSLSTAYLSAGYETGIYHAKGNFSHHLTFGGVMLICTPLAVSLLFCRDWHKMERFLIGIAAIILPLAAFVSLGRSIWLGLAVAFSVLAVRFSPKVMIGFVTLFLMMMVILFINFGEVSLPRQKLESRFDMIRHRLLTGVNLESNQDRLLMWKSAIKGIKDHYWLGIGHSKDEEIMDAYRNEISAETGHSFLNRSSAGVHNIYLQTWLNFGITGFVAYIGIWVVFTTQIVKGIITSNRYDYSNSILWGVLASLSGFMVAGFFENNFRDGEVQTSLLLMVSLALNQIVNNRDNRWKKYMLR